MKSSFTLILSAFLFGGLSLFAQSTNPEINLTPKTVSYTSADLEQSFKAYQVFTMDHAGLSENASKSADLSFGLELSEQEYWQIDLEPFALFSPDFRFRVLTDTGVEYQDAPTNAVFKGRARGAENGEVLMTVWEDYFVLSIRTGSGERFVEPLHKMIPGVPKNLYVSYLAADVLVDPALKCGLTETAEHHDQLPSDLAPEKGEAKMMCDIVFAELALAAAFDMVQKFGTVTDVQQHIVDITTQMMGLYTAENIKYQVVDVVIPNSAAADPWSTDAFMDVLLPDFAAWGNVAGNFAPHDIGQLWVARDVFRTADPMDPDDNPFGLIGRADGIGVVCTDDRYNVCEDFANSMNCLRSLSAHEIGHLWGGVHGDATLDVTIMSPFIACAATVFTAANSNNIAGHVATRTCLTSANDVPPVAVCQDITRSLDANGNVSITPGEINDGSTFSCGSSSLSLDINAFDCGDTGGNTVELTITDINGLSDNCTATVTINDNTNPTISCRDTTLALDLNGMVSIDASILGTTDDNCSSEIDPLFLDFDCEDAGITFINFLDASDPSNGSVSCQINISIIDTLPPVVVGADQTVFLDALGMGSVDSSDIVISAMDNCEVVSVTFSRSLDFTCDDVGAQEVMLTAVDPSGNVGTDIVTVTVMDTVKPVITVTPQTVVLSDDNGTATLTVPDLASATDACGIASLTASQLLFTCEDIGDVEVIITATDVNGNVATAPVVVTVTFNQPELACIGEINLTLNDECQALLIPRMLLVGNVACLDVFNFEITVQDNDPSNGPIIDGCGSFTYSISSPDQPISTSSGFNGSLAAFNWDVEETTTNGDQSASATFTATTLTLATSAAVFDSGSPFGVTADLQFSEIGTVTFDYDYNGVDNGFDDAIILVDFEGNVIVTILDTDQPTTGSASIDVEPGYTLMIGLEDDGFQPFAGAFTSELEISNITFTTGDLLGLNFETCWGIVNAEDKTSPIAEVTPDDVTLLCVDF
ncbi:zinc metalloprotease, partial [Neolewinella persica]|uniref:hypothetical protein n=1 Tax=Neolewinella persica TaxID=70998 RepID=UPI0005C765D5